MAEYVLKEGEDHADVARRLLAESNDPNGVLWAPRPDTYGGGVYVVNDEETVAKVAGDLARVRDAEAQRIADSQAKAEERDARASETGLTPAQLGFPANAGSDPGAPGTEGRTAEDEEADRKQAEADSDAADEENMTPAQRRKAARQAKAEDSAKADSSKDEGQAKTDADRAKSDTATEETK